MKYLPKSKPAAVVAGAYLLLIFILLMVTTFGETGLHAGNGFIAGILIFILALPLSWVGIQINDSFLFLPILILGVLFNAGVIYFVVTFASRALQFVPAPRLK